MDIWEKWIPLNNIPPKLFKDHLIDDENGLKIVFFEEIEGPKYSFLFEGYVHSYRNTDEGSLLKTLEYVDKYYQHLDYGKWTLFKLKQSSYLEWYTEQTFGMYKNIYQIEHYVFFTSDDVIEVLSADPPIITVLT